MLSGPQDASNAYLKIQAGTGGTEACDWAQMLMRMYARWAERHGYQVEMVDELRNEEAGIRSATLHVIGDYAYGHLQSEAGVHRLVRISPFDSNARRQTSFAAVDVTPEIDGTIEIEIKPDDLKRDTFRSGGPGGQHQNKTESGVRYTHMPTGIAAESRTERSQHKNDANAMKLLKAKLYRIEEQKRKAEVEKLYDEKGEVAWGYQIRNYVLQPYTLVKDVRTGVRDGPGAERAGRRDRRVHPGVPAAEGGEGAQASGGEVSRGLRREPGRGVMEGGPGASAPVVLEGVMMTPSVSDVVSMNQELARESTTKRGVTQSRRMWPNSSGLQAARSSWLRTAWTRHSIASWRLRLIRASAS